MKSFNSTVNKERTAFVQFSSAVRLSHEKERSRAERTKYWSIIGSVSGTILGMFLPFCLLSIHRPKHDLYMYIFERNLFLFLLLFIIP